MSKRTGRPAAVGRSFRPFDGDGRKSHRLRLCPVCYEAFVPDLLEVADLQNERGTWVTREERL